MYSADRFPQRNGNLLDERTPLTSTQRSKNHEKNYHINDTGEILQTPGGANKIDIKKNIVQEEKTLITNIDKGFDFPGKKVTVLLYYYVKESMQIMWLLHDVLDVPITLIYICIQYGFLPLYSTPGILHSGI
jgi:hypothetical protein